MVGVSKNTILIVDDEASNLKILTHILSPEYTILISSDGAAAIEMAKEFQPDLILLDIIMPGMDGYEALSALKASDKTRKIPVIIITGLDINEDKIKKMLLDASDYISKPFSSEVVKSKVRSRMPYVNQPKEPL